MLKIFFLVFLFISCFCVNAKQYHESHMYGERCSTNPADEVVESCDMVDSATNCVNKLEVQELTDGEKIREAVAIVVARFDHIGCGNIAQECFNASRIVQIAENPNGWRELLFLMSGLVALIISLFVTKVLASMFNVEVAKLIWIPIGACIAMLIAAFGALKTAGKNKKLLVGGVALSAMGVVSLVNPIRHAFFDFTAWVFIWFAGWYVPLCSFATGLAILLFVFSLCTKNLGGGFGSVGAIVFRNAIGLIVIPFVCAFIFVGIISIFGPWFDANIGSFS